MMFVLLVTGAESSQSRHKVGVGSPMLLLISSTFLQACWRICSWPRTCWPPHPGGAPAAGLGGIVGCSVPDRRLIPVFVFSTKESHRCKPLGPLAASMPLKSSYCSQPLRRGALETTCLAHMLGSIAGMHSVVMAIHIYFVWAMPPLPAPTSECASSACWVGSLPI
jgi:hypothetical protein